MQHRILSTATGSTGTNPVQDSTARGIIAAALSGILAFLQIEFDLVSANGVAALAPVVVLCAFVLAGLWDRFGRPRLRANTVPYPVAPPLPNPDNFLVNSPYELPLSLAEWMGRMEAKLKALEDARS